MANCSESPLLDNCTCSSKFGAGNNTKLFDMDTQQYLCCGNKIPYDMATRLVNNGGNLVNAAAAADDTRCDAWWHTNVNSSQQVGVTGAGPTQSKLDAVQHMANISGAFPPPSIDGKTNLYSCIGKVSSVSGLHTVPRYLSFRNPNAGENYTEMVACVPHDDSKANAPYNFLTGTSFNNTEEFAIFTITGCSDLNSETCITPIDKAPIGSLEFNSGPYNGSKFPHHNNTDDNTVSNMTWIIILVLCGIVVIMIVLLIWALWRSSRRSSPQIIQQREVYPLVGTSAPQVVQQTREVYPLQGVAPAPQMMQQTREVYTLQGQVPSTQPPTVNPVQGFKGGEYYYEIPNSSMDKVLRGT
jgi:hypothetical protein